MVQGMGEGGVGNQTRPQKAGRKDEGETEPRGRWGGVLADRRGMLGHGKGGN